MNANVRLGAIAALLVGSALALSAHHTISTVYDTTRHATIQGVVEGVEWKLPHSFIHLNVVDANGGAGAWQIETEAPYVIRRRNAALLDAIKVGDRITVDVCLSKDGQPRGWLHQLTTSAGMTFEVGAGGC